MTRFPEFLIKEESRYGVTLALAENPRYFKPHRHGNIEFSFIVAGKGHEIINGIRYDLKPGAFSLLLPHHIHQIYSEPDSPLQFYLGSISLSVFMSSEADGYGLGSLLYEGDTPLDPNVIFEPDESLYIKAIFDTMHRELSSASDRWSPMLVKSKLLEAIALFDRKRCASLDVSSSRNLRSKNRTVWNVLYDIHTNFNSELSLGMLAEKYHINKTYLSEQFKINTGTNFVDLLNEVRIQHACSMLLGTGMSVADIAIEVGYASYNSFARIFRRTKGMSPTAYRQQYT